MYCFNSACFLRCQARGCCFFVFLTFDNVDPSIYSASAAFQYFNVDSSIFTLDSLNLIALAFTVPISLFCPRLLVKSRRSLTAFLIRRVALTATCPASFFFSKLASLVEATAVAHCSDRGGSLSGRGCRLLFPSVESRCVTDRMSLPLCY